MCFQPSSHYRLPLLLIALCLLLMPMFAAAQAEIFATETVTAGTQAVSTQETQSAVLTEQFNAEATATSSPVPHEQPAELETVVISNTDTPMAKMRTGINIRRGPGVTFEPPIGSLPQNATSEILAVSLDGLWYKVKYHNGAGWMASWLATVSGDVANLPIEVGPPIIRNDEWVPFERDFDGVAMVLVPTGCFMMGSDNGKEQAQPVHEQCFHQPFWIDKHEVTQVQFRRLGGTQANEPSFSGDNRPVENITWFEARDFCALRDSRLPTEKEWEYAARGPDNLVYPWDNLANPNNAVWSRSILQGTANVGSIPTGISWVGALDMSGNVWEWVSSLYKNYPYKAAVGREDDTGEKTDVRRVVRGGSFVNSMNYLRSSFRDWYNPSDRFNNLGFRCARSYE